MGTSVYLAKQLFDRLSNYSFDPHRLRGIGTRIFVGAMLGTVVVGLVYAKEIQASPGQLPKGVTPWLVAFLAGLGTKPVYAAIEAVVEGLANRIKAPWRDAKK